MCEQNNATTSFQKLPKHFQMTFLFFGSEEFEEPKNISVKSQTAVCKGKLQKLIRIIVHLVLLVTWLIAEALGCAVVRP